MSIIKKILLPILMFFNIDAFASDREAGDKRNAYDFSFTNIDGSKFKLSKFKGQILLVVNTASECGFTSQLAGLEELWNKYKDQGLVIVGVPSNDFGGQEPLSDKEVVKFCELKYNTTFTIVRKEHVKGSASHPFYKWARDQVGYLSAPKWNFHKYLINKDGKIDNFFFSATEPNSAELIQAVENLLIEKSHEGKREE